MKKEEIDTIIEKQRDFFATGRTLDVNYRINALKKLRYAVKKHENEINAALKADLGKSAFEGYMCEIGLTLSELTYMINHTKRFSSEKRVPTPLAQYVSRSYVKPSPYGVTLIMSPWNYPFMLTLDPLADALAAGNTAVLKPSAYSPHTSEVIAKIIRECFDPRYVAVITGGRQENSYLLDGDFDFIFFTGSQAVGKEVMRHAADKLIPVALELGGKSPCIVDSTAKIKLAAKRIVFGKLLNCGQTCVAPDYIYCDERIKGRLIEEIKLQIEKQYGKQPLLNKNYGKIINEKHFERISALIDPEKVVYGGSTDREHLRIEPTILDNVSWDDPVMQEEIFGPVIPVLTFRGIGEAVNRINSMPHPLALYIFSENRQTIGFVTGRCQFGGGCVNDTIIHLATSSMGFGGVGASGMGAYHGKVGFDTFSHKKSIVDKKTFLDLPMRYQPYKDINDKLIRIFLR
ncbi:MAG: aldehyde dehydrogenase [Clostridia bacterium]|nr:aldehyde dehydrogenase [Clostridia bacterium]